MSQNAFDEFAQEPDDKPAVTLGDLRDGEEVTVHLAGEPEVFDSDQYGRGFSVPCLFVSSDYTHKDNDGDEIEGGDEVRLVSWSKRLARTLREFADEHGWDADVTVQKSGNGMDTTYSAERADE